MNEKTVEELVIYLSQAGWGSEALDALAPEERERGRWLYRNGIRSMDDLAAARALGDSLQHRQQIHIRTGALKSVEPGTVCVPVDPIGYGSKEEQEHQFGNIRKRLLDVQNWPTLPDVEFAARCASGHCFGYFWDPAKRSTASEHWQGFQTTALDFDDTLPLETFLERCESTGIEPSFVYKTFGHGVRGERYRAVFIMTHKIHDVQLWRAVMFALESLFPEADKCFDAAHVFRGGNGLLYENYGARNHPIELVEDALFFKYNTDPAHHSDFIAKFAAATGICFRGRYLDIVPYSQVYLDGNQGCDFIDIGTPVSGFKGKTNHKTTWLNGTPCINNSDTRLTISPSDFPLEPLDTQRWYLKSALTESAAKRHILQGLAVSVFPSIGRTGRKSGRAIKDWAKSLEERCKCFEVFTNHTKRLDHDTRLMLASNLTKLSGGEKIFIEGIDTSLYDTGSQKKWRYDIRMIKQRYADSPYVTCEYGRCPFQAECTKPGSSFMSLLPRKKWEIRPVNNFRQTVSLTESRLALDEAFREAYAATGNGIHVIRTDVGVGKTHAMLNTLLENTAVASPTHALNEESYGRYAMGPALLWRKLPDLPEPFQGEIERRHRSGLGKVTALVRKWLDSSIPAKYRDTERQCYEYLHNSRLIRRAGVVFLTHEKVFSLTNSRVRTVIFDEDPIYSLLKMTVVQSADVRALLTYLRGKRNPALKPIIDYAESVLLTDGDIKERVHDFRLVSIMGLIQDDNAPKFQSPIASIFSSHFYHKNRDGDITCLERRALNPDRKYIILSATANETIYRKLFGERLHFTDLSSTETKGKLILHSEQSYSRTCIAQLGKEEFIRAVTGDVSTYGLDGVIVYKAHEEQRGTEIFLTGTDVPVFCHYGTQYGLNGFSGKRIGIYGVPHKPDEVYKMYGRALGINANEAMSVHEVVRNGFEFSLWTYGDADMKELQLWMLESELMQAVGRARLVSEPEAAVHLFSNYPLPGCILAE